MSNHTPGPWESKSSNAERYSQYIAPVNLLSWPYDVIAYIPEAYGEKCSFPGSHMANARLIAAAPELLEALEDLLEVVQVNLGLEARNAVAAIAKAKGKS